MSVYTVEFVCALWGKCAHREALLETPHDSWSMDCCLGRQHYHYHEHEHHRRSWSLRTRSSSIMPAALLQYGHRQSLCRLTSERWLPPSCVPQSPPGDRTEPNPMNAAGQTCCWLSPSPSSSSGQASCASLRLAGSSWLPRSNGATGRPSCSHSAELAIEDLDLTSTCVAADEDANCCDGNTCCPAAPALRGRVVEVHDLTDRPAANLGWVGTSLRMLAAQDFPIDGRLGRAAWQIERGMVRNMLYNPQA